MKKILIFLLFLPSFLAFSQNRSPKDIQNYLQSLRQDPDLLHASIGFYAVYTQNKQIIAQHNAQQSLCAASNLKLLTAGAALGILGKNFRFQTFLEHDGTIQKNSLNGNLYITGGGDPSLGKDNIDDLMRLLVKKIKEKGITNIKGNLIADSDIFDDQAMPDQWLWSDLGCYYGAGAFGLNIQKNLYKIYFRTPNENGKNTTFVKTEPAMKNITFVNEVRTGGYSDKAFIFGIPYTYLRYMRGTIPAAKNIFIVKGAIPDPPLFFSEYLKDFLLKNGIKVSGKATCSRLLRLKGQLPKTARKKIFVIQSEILSELIKEMNIKSDNVYAESLLKTIGLKTKKSTKFEDATQALLDFWKKKGLDTNGLIVEDGSGMARSNALTAKSLATALQIMEKDANFSPFFYSLAVAGKTGTLKNKGKKTAAENNLRAKSGSMGGVRAYSGYVNSRSGKRIAFSILVNNFVGEELKMNQKLEKLMVLLAELE